MIGLDTTVLIAFDIQEHPLHSRVKAGLSTRLNQSDMLMITPQVFHEYLHVITDAKRFEKPLSMPEALNRVRFWREAKEVKLLYPNNQSGIQLEQWMHHYQLGRKRILDTALASVYHAHGIRQLATANPKDFALFDVFNFETWAVA